MLGENLPHPLPLEMWPEKAQKIILDSGLQQAYKGLYDELIPQPVKGGAAR